MCYTQTLNNKGLRFSISNCFGFGFDWTDEEFVKAVRNKDERIWEILKWAANGGAEEYDQAASFEETLSYDEPDQMLRVLRHMDQEEKLDNLLDNQYLSEQYKTLITQYRDGTLEKRVRAEQPKKAIKASAIGYVYLILAENGLYKIGKAKNLTSRLKPFTVNFPMKWDLVHSFQSNDYSNAELTLHEMFADKRDVGEWFRLSPEDVEYITAIQDGAL